MKKSHSLFFYFLLFWLLPGFSQNPKQIDSLKVLIPTLKADSAKLIALNTLCRYLVDIDPLQSVSYAKEALKISEDKNFKMYQAMALKSIGDGYYNLADYKTSLKFYLQALFIQESIGNKNGIISSSGSIGNIYLGLGKPDDALNYFERALEIAREIKSKNAEASCFISIGTIYSDKGQPEKALGYYFKSLDLFLDVKNEEAIATNYNNIADTYLDMKDYPKSLFYIVKAAELYEKIGNVYGQSLALNNIGDYYIAIGEEEKAIEYYNRGLEKGKLIEANEHIIQSYKGLSASYKKSGNYKQALLYYENFHELSDSVFNLENSKQIAEMETRFNTEKKQQEIELLTKDKKIHEDEMNRQTLISRGILCGGGLLLLLTVVATRAYLQKRNTSRELGLKNEKIELAYNIIEDQHKDIKDSINYAKRIQDAILPPDSVMKELLPDSFVLNMPKDIVSGDFYWVEPWGSKVFFAAVDCTGHGVPGALMSIIGYNLLGKALNELGLSRPALILNSLSKGIGKTLRQTEGDSGVKDGMDIALCSLDMKTNIIEYAGAYNPMYIVRNGKLIETASDKISIGTSMDSELRTYTNHEIQLQKGDTVYLFTDGYADQFGGDKGKKFKYKSLQQLFISLEGKAMSEQKIILHSTIEKWKGNLGQVDDVLVIGVRV